MSDVRPEIPRLALPLRFYEELIQYRRSERLHCQFVFPLSGFVLRN